MSIKEKQKEFIKMYLTGKFSQKKIAGIIGISETTASSWVKTLPSIKYYEVKKELLKQLNTLSKEPNYKENAAMITQLIADIESIEKLITKAVNAK